MSDAPASVGPESALKTAETGQTATPAGETPAQETAGREAPARGAQAAAYGDGRRAAHVAQPEIPRAKPRGSLRRFAMPAAGAVVLILLIAAVVYWQRNAGLVKTDNAQTAGDVAPVSAQIPGTVTKVHVIENQHVTGGTVLVELDPADYRLALSRAEATLSAARAQVSAAEAALSSQEQQFAAGVNVARAALGATQPKLPQAQAQLTMQQGTTEAQVAQAQEQVKTAQAAIVAARASLDTASRTMSRDRQLLAQGAIAQSQVDTDSVAFESAQAQYQAAQNNLKQAQANLAAAEASRQQVEIARSAVAVNAGQVAQAQAQVAQAQAGASLVQQRAQELAAARANAANAAEAVKTAQLSLSRTLIRAPADGWVTNRTVEIGQVVQPNQPLMSLILSQRVWVVANIKETQLGRIRVGDPVRITVDAYRGRTLRGHVESIGSATGSTTALLPPDNATGNFVKVVQLVPVRIALDPGTDQQLQVGLSAEVAIDTRHPTR